MCAMNINRQSCYCTKPLTPLTSHSNDDKDDPIDTKAIGIEVIGGDTDGKSLLFIKRLSHRFLKRVSTDEHNHTSHRRTHLQPLVDLRRRSHQGTSYNCQLDRGRELGNMLQVQSHEPRRRLMLGRFVVLALAKALVRLSTVSASTSEPRSKLPESHHLPPLLPLLKALLKALLPLLDRHLFELVSLVSLSGHQEDHTPNSKAANATMATISISTLGEGDALENLVPPPRNPQRLLKRQSLAPPRDESFYLWLRSLLPPPETSLPKLLPPQKAVNDKRFAIVDDSIIIANDPTAGPEANDDMEDETADELSPSDFLKIKLFVYDRSPRIYRIKVARERIHDRYDLQMAIFIRLMEKRLLYLELDRLKLSIFFRNPKLPQVVFKDPDEPDDQCELLKIWRDELVMDYVRVKERINVRVTQQPKYMPPLPVEALAQVASTA